MNKPNHLVKESSPYLLQHAYNPVDWHPWSDESLAKAREQDKMILVSIGYSACHWCHVMEHESFEDAEVAELMNRFFICIKVDREERPDIDQVYMSAVQLMTGRGGWPLNCFTLPDGRPVYGGTYFPKQQWMNILLNLADGYKDDKSKFIDYATQLTDGIRQSELINESKPVLPPLETESPFSSVLLNEAVVKWKDFFDNEHGGPSKAPKFPLPNNYLFLLKYAFVTGDESLISHVQLTLKKMAYGGIYDQIGGGFSRYSVDGIWKVPHFEKMLYDNAQLVTLYSEAYKHYRDPLYREVVYQTLGFIERELKGTEGNFYSALDADSEGVEGKYYIWSASELKRILAQDYEFFADVFNVNPKGFWEHDNYILLRDQEDDVLTKKWNLSYDDFKSKVEKLSRQVLNEREKRIHPGLDDKTLLSWNALMINAYLDAYDAFGEKKWYDIAAGTIAFISKKMTKDDGGLFHNYKNSRATINAFLEDYSFFIHALIRMYQVSLEIDYLEKARELTIYSIENFAEADNSLFYFSSVKDAPLISRSKEVQDNVIPASNSQMAINLYFLGNYFEIKEWITRSELMLINMKNHLQGYGSGYSNWLLLWMYNSYPLKELVICGMNALQIREQIFKTPVPPGLISAGAINNETLPMTQGRLTSDKTIVYVCKDHSCHLPVQTVEETLGILNQ